MNKRKDLHKKLKRRKGLISLRGAIGLLVRLDRLGLDSLKDQYERRIAQLRLDYLKSHNANCAPIMGQMSQATIAYKKQVRVLASSHVAPRSKYRKRKSTNLLVDTLDKQVNNT